MIINKGGQVTKSIIVVTICYKLLCHSSRFLISNFLASTDINVFGRTYLFAMLLLIDLALFLHPGCFCLVILTVAPSEVKRFLPAQIQPMMIPTAFEDHELVFAAW